MVILFTSIYIPRYARQSNVRQKKCRETFIQQKILVFRVPDATSLGSELNLGEYLFRFSREQSLNIGTVYQLTGRSYDIVQCESSSQIALNIQRIEEITWNSLSVFDHVRFLPTKLLSLVTMAQQRAEARIRLNLPAQHVEILFGMVFGRKPSQAHQLSTLFKQTGLIHVLVASGANVALIALLSQSVMRKLFSRRMSVYFALIIVGVYALISGAQPPIVRAALMYLFSTLAILYGRKVSAVYCLAVSVGIILINQPFLIYSVSLYLSVSATIGMLFATEYAQKRALMRSYFSTSSILGESLFTSLVIFLFTLPILAHFFGDISLLGILTTASTSSLVGIITLIGCCTILLVAVLPAVFTPFLLMPLWGMIEIFIRLINLFEKLSFLHFQIHELSFLAVFLWYFVLLLYFSIHLAASREKR